MESLKLRSSKFLMADNFSWEIPIPLSIIRNSISFLPGSFTLPFYSLVLILQTGLPLLQEVSIIVRIHKLGDIHHD